QVGADHHARWGQRGRYAPVGSVVDIDLRSAHTSSGLRPAAPCPGPPCTAPCALHRADQPDGVTCTTIRRPHCGQ
ncbi:MAG: hypothetical protein ACRDSN_08580, partial [Pseudonocardiaceae bacterium]